LSLELVEKDLQVE
jgi:uncharacterized coiled-coil protein SlyX